MAFNPTNLSLWSAPNAPGPQEIGYKTTDTVATTTVSTYFNVFGKPSLPNILPVTINPQDLIVATCSDGVAFLRVVTINPIVTEVDTDEGAATRQLDNLTGVAINTSLISDTDITDDLGSAAIRWNNIYSATLRTGDTAADTLVIGARDVDGAVWTPFITLTANNTPTCVLADGVTATTQAPADNSTLVATTAYVDAVGTASANTALSNLASVAINTSLISDTDVTDSLGSQAIRWSRIFTNTVETGDTAADTLILRGWDVDGAVPVDFVTITANNTPTCVLNGDITSTTQSVGDNSTKLATTAYADAQVASVMKYVAVPMTAAEWNGMYAAPFVLVAAGAAGTEHRVHSVEIEVNFSGAQFGNGGVTNVQYDSTVNGAGVAASGTIAAATVQAWAADATIGVAGASANGAASAKVAKGLYLSNQTAAFDTGDTTTFVVHLWYSTITTTL